LHGLACVAVPFLGPAGGADDVVLGSTLFGAASAVLILFLVLAPGSVFARALAWRPLVFLGNVSYFVYLFHLPVLYVLRVAAVRALRESAAGSVDATLAAGAIATLALGAFSRRFLEQPLIRYGKTLA
jgi:peptidoglycan/LPS O-acetylase OafA/YrhL